MHEPGAESPLDGELSACLDHWRQIAKEAAEEEVRAIPATAWAPESVEDIIARRQSRIDKQADDVRQHLHHLRRNDLPPPEELLEIAGSLSPGGVHTGGWLANIFLHNVYWANQAVIAALLSVNWHGGKAGFQFLPDPLAADPDEYDDQASMVFSALKDGVPTPAALLGRQDFAFYSELPQRFTIYRGTAGISAEQAAAGLCWTTSREVAEWFGWRSAGFNGGPPVLVSARVLKQDIALAKAAELEVVARPRRFRTLKCRPHPPGWQPYMGPD